VSGSRADVATPALTLESVLVRSLALPLRRPIVSKVGSYDDWPLILIDLRTREGVVGHSYLEPYLVGAARYIVPLIEELPSERQGAALRPLDDFDASRKALSLVGYEGVAMLAVSGFDMAACDALAATQREGEARELFGRLTALCNDVGLLAEQYDTDRDRLVGNFPQALSHLALVSSALALERSSACQEARTA
jgi:Mandelate racemase / muconate lactonizing enzyme, N-terminal domain